ncbi:MAG: hypothetical protein ACI35S_00605 [Anaeroplasma sp.]
MNKVYNKIVRNKIPDLIIEENEKAIVKSRTITDEDELVNAFCNKIIEEVEELRESYKESGKIDRDCIGELNDVIDSVKELTNIMTTTGENKILLHITALEKNIIKGDFSDHLFLESVNDCSIENFVKGKVLVYSANRNLYKDKYDILLDHDESYGEKLPVFISKGEEFYSLRMTQKLTQELFKDFDGIVQHRFFYGEEIMINKTMDKWVFIENDKKKYFNFLREENYESDNKN